MKKNFRSLEIAAKTLINSFGSGSHISGLKDSIIDVDVVREYQPGDRRLDSRSSMRTSKTMSRVFNPEKSMSVILLMDMSASTYSKQEAMTSTALYLSFLAEKAADTVGLIAFNNTTISMVEPTDDIRDVTDLLERTYNKEPIGETSLKTCLSRAASMGLDNTLFVLLSDFCYDLSDNDVSMVKRLLSGKNNSMLACAFYHSDEWAVSSQSFKVDFIDAESGESASWDFRHASSPLDVWKLDTKLKLRQARSEPIFVQVDCKDFLMPIVRYFLRG